MLKSKSSRWLAGPYLLWMAIFTIVPLLIVIWYAMTNADGQFTLDNLTQIGRYSSVFARSLILAAISTVVCLVDGVPGRVFSLPPARQQAAYHAHAYYAAHVDELPAAHLRMDDPA